eukprot:tig00020999_g16978.t1
MLPQRAQAEREARAPPSGDATTALLDASASEPSEDTGGGTSSAASTLKRQWAHGSAAQRREVATDVRARYHRAFAVLHVAFLLSVRASPYRALPNSKWSVTVGGQVLALLAALLANFHVPSAERDADALVRPLHGRGARAPFLRSRGPLPAALEFEVKLGPQKARAFQLAVLASPPPLVPPALRGPAAAAAAAAQLRECTEDLRRALQACRIGERALVVQRHCAGAGTASKRPGHAGAGRPPSTSGPAAAAAAAAAAVSQRNRTVTLLDGLLTALRSAEDVLAAAALLPAAAAAAGPPAAAAANASASASALRAIAAGRMTPGLFFLLANSHVALPGGNLAVAFSFVTSSIHRLGAMRRSSLALFCAAAGLAVFLMHARPAIGPALAPPHRAPRFGVMLPVLWYVRWTRDRLLRVFLQARSALPRPPLPPRIKIEDPTQIPRSTAREIRAEILGPLFPKREEAAPDATGGEAQAYGADTPNLQSDEAAASSPSERGGGVEGEGEEEGEAPALGSEAPSGDREDEVRRAV